MRESMHFIYDNINSKDMGVMLVSPKGGLLEENFLPNRTIIEKNITYREKPYFQRVEHKPLSFSITIFIENWKEELSLRKIAKWFFQDYYKPLVFDSNPNRIFYAMFEGDSSIIHNGLKEGYIELNIRCDSPYGYTAEKTENNIEFRDSNVGVVVSNNIITFDNGKHDNTVTTDNGLTIENPIMTWERFYQLYEKWGEIENGINKQFKFKKDHLINLG